MKCLIYCIINFNLEGGALCFACNKYFAYKLVFVFKYNKNTIKIALLMK